MDHQIQDIDAIYKRMNDDTEEESEQKHRSEIQDFFSGKTIFLTGCTGFIGKCLVEKILRTCPDIKRLYILARGKKESVEKRMDKYFANVLFEPLRNARPDFRKQITIIEGDLTMPGMGLSPEDRQLLVETLDLIVHNAAMVIFSAKVSILLKTNVLGTKEMLDLAVECHHLEGFMYISTAYSHCYLQTIEEKFYTPPGDLEIVRDMIKADEENEAGLSENVLKSILGPCPNAYIFTKAIAESMVQEYARKVPFPCGIFRMSIVISTYKEPLRGWCGNLNGPTYSIMAASLGLVHVIYVAENGAPDLIPADMTANATWVSVWDLVVNKKDCKEGCIYNYGSSTINPIRYEILRDKTYDHGITCPSKRTMGLFFVFIVHNYPLFLLNHILFHYFPAVLADIVRLVVQRKKPTLIPLLIKIEKHMKELLYFSTQNWNIKLGEMFRIWDRLNPVDQELFFSDLRKLNWDDYCTTYWHGMRVYLLREPMDNIVYGKRRYNIVIAVWYTIIAAMVVLACYTVYKTVNFSRV